MMIIETCFVILNKLIRDLMHLRFEYLIRQRNTVQSYLSRRLTIKRIKSQCIDQCRLMKKTDE